MEKKKKYYFATTTVAFRVKIGIDHPYYIDLAQKTCTGVDYFFVVVVAAALRRK